MIEIYSKLGKSNTQLKFRRMIFRSALFHFKLLQTETVF